ncbi:hypothetical protein MKX03_030600, partial [Papaver bracteatum]
MRTQGRRSVPPPAENEIPQRSNQLHNNRIQASLQPSHRSAQKAIRNSASPSQQSHRSQQRNNLPDSPAENHNFLQPNRSNKTINIVVGKRGKEKADMACINSIGSWVRQRDNWLLTYDKFDDMPEQKISRVILNVRDHFNLVPDDDEAVQAIKTVMRSAYKAHRHKIHLTYKKAGGDRFAASDGHLEALAHPPEIFSNKRDWAHMCGHFTTDEFKKKYERGRAAATAKQLKGINHSNENKSFTSIEYDLPDNLVILTFFRRTHDPEKKINAKCKEMSEAVDRGETNDTPEEIFKKVCNAGCSGKRHRKFIPEERRINGRIESKNGILEHENKRLKKET